MLQINLAHEIVSLNPETFISFILKVFPLLG